MEAYKFLGPNKEFLKNRTKSTISFVFRRKKVYVGLGRKGFDNIIKRDKELSKKAVQYGKESILKYCGFIFPDNKVIIINNFLPKVTFLKYLILLDRHITKVKRIESLELEPLYIKKNKEDWLYKAGTMKYISVAKYVPGKLENIILSSQEKDTKSVNDDSEQVKTKKGDIVIVPTSKEIRKEIGDDIKNKIQNNKEKVSYRTIFGRKYIVGIDDKKNVTVYDWDGSNYELDDFYSIVKDRRKQEQKLNNINKLDLYLDFIDKEPETFVDDFYEANKDKVEYELLTDRDDINKKLSRSYPVLEYEGRKLIVGGRFKGYYLDEMVNLAGRQIAGSAYYLDEGGMPRLMETKNSTLDERTITVQHEPYVTYDEDKNGMVMIIPDNDKKTHAILHALAKEHGSIRSKSKNTYTFTPMMYEIIQRDVKGFVLSEKASKIIHSTIKTNKQKIIDEINNNYDHISTSTIPGMKTEFENGRKIEFFSHQKKSIDYLDKNGNGLIGLDTGTGKTMVAIGIMMKWINDGTLYKDGKNGKLLFIGDASLRGNFPSEVKMFVDDFDFIKKHFDVVSYYQFQKRSEEYKEYGVLVFDEAQAMRSSKSKIHRIAKKTIHPRKILMTASILEKSPLDLYNLIAIKNNINIETAKDDSKRRNDFINTFCERVGGKIIGLKEDATTKKMFRKWVKKETIYIDKTEVQEVDLPSITSPEDRTISIEMPQELKDKYTELSEPIKDTLTRMVQKYKNKDLTKNDINQELSKVMGTLQKLTTLLALPETVLGEDFPNPKVEHAIKHLQDKLSGNDNFRMITFTDKPALAKKMGLEVSKKIMSKLHIVGLADGIEVYKDGSLIEKITSGKAKKYFGSDGKPLSANNYQVELLKQFKNNYDVTTLNLTKAYTKGHNLQNFNAILHLDRDTWNNENMEQRNARTYRTGTEYPVEVKILDLVNDSGTSLDEIQGHSMEIERKLFDELITKSFDDEFLLKDQDVVTITDLQQLIKNKEAYYYTLDPNNRNTFSIKNEKV